MDAVTLTAQPAVARSAPARPAADAPGTDDFGAALDHANSPYDADARPGATPARGTSEPHAAAPATKSTAPASSAGARKPAQGQGSTVPAKAAGTAAAKAADPSDQPDEADDPDEDAPVTVARPATGEDDAQVSPLLAQGWSATQAAPEPSQPLAPVAPPAPSNAVDEAAAPAAAVAAAPAVARETEQAPVAAATAWADGRRAVTAVDGEAVATTATPAPSTPGTADARGLSSPASPASPDDPASNAPFTGTDASPASRATGAAPAARAYLKAARALEAGAWAQEAGPSDNLPRASEVRAAQPTPAGVAGENRPRDVGPALSAHAAAVLRSLGLTNAGTTEDSESVATPAAASIGDVMGGVAVELAAVDLGSSRRDADPHSHSGSAAKPNVPSADASDILSSSSVFSLGTEAAPAAAGDRATLPSQPVAGAPAPEAPLTGQMVKAIALAWRDGVGEAKIRLTPEHLGEVQVSMKVERGQVVAQVVAETAIARAWIDTHQQDLREALAQQGLQLDKLVVTADGQRQQQPQGDGSERQRRPPARLRNGEPAPRFELSA